MYIYIYVYVKALVRKITIAIGHVKIIAKKQFYVARIPRNTQP